MREEQDLRQALQEEASDKHGSSMALQPTDKRRHTMSVSLVYASSNLARVFID